MPLSKTGSGIASGIPENPDGRGGDSQRSIRRQNEAADMLVSAGYNLEHNPAVQPADGLLEKNPDFRIEGIIFDCYSPIDQYPANPLAGYATQRDHNVGQGVRELIALTTMFPIPVYMANIYKNKREFHMPRFVREYMRK